MAKGEIIKTIVEQHGDNERVLNSLFGHVIIEACKKELNRPIEESFPLIKAAHALIVQIDGLKTKVQFIKDDVKYLEKLNEEGFPFPYTFETQEKEISDNEEKIKMLYASIENILNQL
jgi:hypothetical protein